MGVIRLANNYLEWILRLPFALFGVISAMTLALMARVRLPVPIAMLRRHDALGFEHAMDRLRLVFAIELAIGDDQTNRSNLHGIVGQWTTRLVQIGAGQSQPR